MTDSKFQMPLHNAHQVTKVDMTGEATDRERESTRDDGFRTQETTQGEEEEEEG